MSEQLPGEIGQLLVVYNPANTHPAAGRAYMHRLEETYGSVITEIQTDPDPTVTQRKVQDNLQADVTNRVAVIGGDGSGGAVATGLASQEVIDTYGIVGLALLPTGGANDLYYAFAGKGADPVQTVSKSEALGIRPVRAEVEPPEAPADTHRAAAYLSLGASALGGMYLNRQDVRARRGPTIIRDASTVGYTLARARRFHLANETTGEKRLLWDAVFPAIPRMAKYVTFPHVNCEDTQLHIYTLSGWRPLIAGMISAAIHLVDHHTVPAHEHVSYRLGERPKQGIWMQHDGETAHIPAGSSITVSRETVPYYLIHP